LEYRGNALNAADSFLFAKAVGEDIGTAVLHVVNRQGVSLGAEPTKNTDCKKMVELSSDKLKTVIENAPSKKTLEITLQQN
jgi:hypothetical protein